MHFVMHVFSSCVEVLHNVTPFVPLQQTAVLFDGVVASVPINSSPVERLIPLLWRGVKPVHFVMHVFSSCVEVLHNVTPFVPLQQTAVLFDGVVVACLYKYSARLFPSCGAANSPPMEGCQAPLDGVVASVPINSPPVEGWQACAFCNACV